MHPEFSAPDLLKIGGVYVATTLATLATLAWLLRSRQSKLPKSAAAVIGVCIRNALAHAIFLAVLVGWGDWTVDQILEWSPLWLVLFALSFPSVLEVLARIMLGGATGGSSAFDAAPGLVFVAFCAACYVVFVGPFFFLRQLVVGFVDLRHVRNRFLEWQREPFIQDKPTATAAVAPQQNSVPIGVHAVVIATLRPLGKVRIGDTEHNARHVANKFVDSGSSVEVTGHEDGLLLVKERAESSLSAE